MVKKRLKPKEKGVADTDLKDLKKLNAIGVKAMLTLSLAEVEKDVEIIIGSWHGPDTENDLSRKEVVKELCSYMEVISAGKPWIVGGGFIVAHSKIKNDIP